MKGAIIIVDGHTWKNTLIRNGIRTTALPPAPAANFGKVKIMTNASAITRIDMDRLNCKHRERDGNGTMTGMARIMNHTHRI